MLEQYQCQDCFISFDTQKALANHKQKFCLHSKYGDLDSLTKQFSQLKGPKKNHNLDNFMQSSSANLDFPLQQHLKTSNSSNKNDLDRQYRELLRQIGDREDLKKKLEREKINAEEELKGLETKEKETFMNVRQQELEEVINRREQLAKEEEQLQKEIRSFEKEKKEESRIKNMNFNEDFQYREGREAGKIAMQRRLLEEKKRDIEANLKRKHREEEKILKEIDSIKDKPIYIPEYRKKQDASVIEKPNQIFQTVQSNGSNSILSPTKRLFSNQQPYESLQIASRTKQLPQNQTRSYMPTESILKPEMMSRQNVLQVSNSKKSQLSQVKEEDDEYLKAALFSGKEKTLFESLNPKGKSDEDLFIESLVAQEFDALNVLARLPKDSELYMVKMKQFQEMSRLRQDLKDKVHKVRLEKVKKEFEIEKQMTETEKANLQWLDKNRRHMLNRQVDIINQNHARQQQQLQLENQKTNYPDVIEETKRSNPYKQRTSLITPPAKMPSIQAFSRGQIKSENGSRGYKISIRSVKNYSSRSPMCVRVMVLEEGDKSGQWVFTTKYHDEQGPRDERDPYNPGIRNRMDEAGSVVFNETFDMREDLQNRYNKNQKEIYLWTMLMEKDNLKLSNEPQLYLWYCLKLTHFGQIKEGVFTLSLYHDNFPFPNPPDMNRMKAKATEELVIQLSDTILTNVQKSVKEVERLESSSSIKNSIGKRLSSKQTKIMKPKKISKEGTLQSINEQFFIENQNLSEFQSVKREDKVSFDFGINGLRTLPSYTGPIRLQVSFIDCEDNQVLERDEILGEFGEDMYNPRVNFTKRVKNRSIPSSTIVIIKIIGIVTLNFEPGLLGFASFHLCFDEEGNALESDKDSYFLINGLYQLPIYWGNTSRYFSANQLEFIYPAIPCSSILVSVTHPSETPKVAPKYSEGGYNTTFFEVDEVQYRLFQEQAKREKLKTLEYVNSYYKFKGVNTTEYREEDLKKLLNQALAFNNENTSNLFMLGWMAEYSTSFGLKFALDSIRVPSNQTNYYYFCTACLFPPAEYYSTQQQADLQFFYHIDLGTSFTSCLQLKHQPLNFFPKYHPSTSLIIEVNRVKLSENGSPDSPIQTCAYTVLPLFDLSQPVPCINVGIKEMKMVEGEFGQRELKELEANAVKFIELMEGQKKSQFVTIGRILNGYFGKQVPPAISNKAQGKSLRSIFQNSKGFRSAEESIKKIIEDTYGVRLS